jgi:hypothetical protein
MLGKRADLVVGVYLKVVAWQRGLMTMMYELGALVKYGSSMTV